MNLLWSNPSNNFPNIPLNPKQLVRTITGVVTKLYDTFGYVNNEIFFLRTQLPIGSTIKTGDKVSVVAVYQHDMPIKWNAKSINLYYGGGSSSYQGTGKHFSTPVKSVTTPAAAKPITKPPSAPAAQPKPAPSSTTLPAKRRLDDQPSKTGQEDNNKHSDEVTARFCNLRESDISDADDDDEEDQIKELVMPRAVHICKEAGVGELKLRYEGLYVPSSLIKVVYTWQSLFPIYRPAKLLINGEKTTDNIKFHVIDKDINWPSIETTPQHATFDPLLDPEDADFTWSVRVVPINMPSMRDIYACLNMDVYNTETNGTEPLTTPWKMMSEGHKAFELRPWHPADMVQLILGSISPDHDPIALGGAWSPSLDGADPIGDPKVLVNTAVRTCLAMANLDLSSCEVWHRMLEFKYYIPPENGTTGTMETVVYLVPELWATNSDESLGDATLQHIGITEPSTEAYADTKAWFEAELQRKLNPPLVEPEEVVIIDDDEGGNTNNMNEDDDDIIEIVDVDTKESGDVTNEPGSENSARIAAEQLHLTLDSIKTMKLADLRQTLLNLGLNTKGIKAQLVARLENVIAPTKQQEETGTENNADDEFSVKRRRTMPPLDSNDARLTKMYTLPSDPCIILKPNPLAKGGKFRLNLTSLREFLTDYGVDSKYCDDVMRDYSFELILFAEQLSEMLQRDAAYVCYKAVTVTPSMVEQVSKAKVENLVFKSGNGPVVTGQGFRGGRGNQQQLKRGEEKLVCVNAPLLLSFLYFDMNRCDYLTLLHLERMINGIGICMSKHQMQTVIQNIINTECLTPKLQPTILLYRLLTDACISTLADANKPGSEYDVTQTLSHALLNCPDIQDMDYIIELCLGNKSLINSDGLLLSEQRHWQTTQAVVRKEASLSEVGDTRINRLTIEVANIDQETKETASHFGAIRVKTRANLLRQAAIQDRIDHEAANLARTQKIEYGYTNLYNIGRKLLHYAKDNANQGLREFNRLNTEYNMSKKMTS